MARVRISHCLLQQQLAYRPITGLTENAGHEIGGENI